MIIEEQLAGDPLFWTPEMVRQELTTTRQTLDQVNADVSAASGKGQISNTEWGQWRDFYTEKHRWTQDASGWWGGNVEIARKIRRDALKWRDLVKSRGARVTGPEPTDPRIEDEPDKPAPAWMKWGVVGVVSVASIPIIKALAGLIPRRNPARRRRRRRRLRSYR